MEIYGNKLSDTEKTNLIQLNNVAFSVDRDALNELAKFFTYAVAEYDRLGDDFNHVHLQDKWSGWNSELPDIQIINASA